MDAFIGDGLTIIASKLGTPMLLDSYKTTMCEESWDRNIYARALIELNVDNELKDWLVAIITWLDKPAYTRASIRVDPLGVVCVKKFITRMLNVQIQLVFQSPMLH